MDCKLILCYVIFINVYYCEFVYQTFVYNFICILLSILLVLYVKDLKQNDFLYIWKIKFTKLFKLNWIELKKSVYYYPIHHCSLASAQQLTLRSLDLPYRMGKVPWFWLWSSLQPQAAQWSLPAWCSAPHPPSSPPVSEWYKAYLQPKEMESIYREAEYLYFLNIYMCKRGPMCCRFNSK